LSTALAETPSLRSLSLTGATPWQVLTATLFAAGLCIGLSIPTPDVSWLLIVGQRMLHGQRLYLDVLEVNPPLSALLYLPAAALADLLGLRAESVVAVSCILGASASLALTGAILRPLIGPDPVRAWRLAAAGAFVLCVLPAAAFGEREHIAVMALLPALALAMARAEGHAPPWSQVVLAGMGLGLTVAIKPHFAAVAAFPVLWAMWRGRASRPWTWPELWIAALAVGAYALAVLAWFPTYLTRVLPVARDVYVPIRASWRELLTLPALPLALAAAALARVMRLDGRWLAVPMLAALGGALAYLAQGKGWPYHAYPMLAFATLGLLAPAAMTPRAWSRLDRLMLLAPSLCALWVLAENVQPASLARAVEAAGPSSPRLIAITGNMGMGVPLVPILHARWIGAAHSDWIAEGAMRREEAGGLDPSTRARLDDLIAQDRARLARDIHAGHPDVVLFDRKTFDWRAWALEDPSIAADMRAYRLTGVVQRIEVWARLS
jgi:hypothetical protein